MSKSSCVCVFLLLLPGLSSGKGSIPKHVCLGEPVELWQNIPFESSLVNMSFYVSDEPVWIVVWSMQNHTPKFSFLTGYRQQVFHDGYGNIWIRNVDLSDEGTYVVNYKVDGYSLQHEMVIDVMVAPKSFCKPNLKLVGRKLFASLDNNHCGKPKAHVQWLEYPGMNTSKTLAMLEPGMHAGTYYVCIKGRALKCAKTSAPSDYCSAITIPESPLLSSAISVEKISQIFIFIIVSICRLPYLHITEWMEGNKSVSRSVLKRRTRPM